MGRVLVIAQEINQSYINLILDSVGKETTLDVISGSSLSGARINCIKSPNHDPRSFKSRLLCWYRHYRFVKKWAKTNSFKYDFLFATSNPPINSYIGLKLKKCLKVPFVYMNWDLYPQIIESNVSPLVSIIPCLLWRKWNNQNYPKIDYMLTIGCKMEESIRKATISNVRISVVPLGVDSNILKPIRKADNLFLIKNKISDKFVVLFSGKMGIGHNIELILKAAEKLRSIEEILFVFIGSGPKFQLIDTYIKDNSSPNIKLFPWQDYEMYPYSIACGEIAIVTEEREVEGLMLPSRVFSMMSCGEAIIGVCGENDDLFNIIKTNNVGICIVNNRVEELSKAIKSLYFDKAKLTSMQHNARRLVEEQYSLEKTTKAYMNIFNSIKGEAN